MQLKPLLVFHPPQQTDQSGKAGKRIIPKVVGPGREEQAERILSAIQQLDKQFTGYAQLVSSPDGLLPEKTLVLEIAGSVDNLAKALSKVPGFQFISCELSDEQMEDERFYCLDKRQNPVPVKRYVYFTMSNHHGLHRLAAAWRKVQKGELLEKGLAPLKAALDQIIDIRFWDTSDRLHNTGFMECWNEQLKVEHDRNALVSFEIELWFRPSSGQRAQAESRITTLIKAAGGTIHSTCLYEQICYHALIGQLPAYKISEVIASVGSTLELMRCDDVMFFRPVGQCMPSVGEPGRELLEDNIVEPAEIVSEAPPTVALLDGYPLTNHTLLKERLIIDDPDNFSAAYSNPVDQIHGTAMASLIIHGDLNYSKRLSLDRRLYVRPIMVPGPEDMQHQRPERIPGEYLPVELIYRAVKRMKEGDSGQPPSAPDVTIINLSVGDRYRLFDTQMSPWARMLDWLSVRYHVLFVVSAGNVGHQLVFNGVNTSMLRSMLPMTLEDKAIMLIANQRQWRRMMSPAEAINALTVGAMHSDGFRGEVSDELVDVFCSDDMFSPINPVTLGYRKSIKPEIHMPGGRVVYRNKNSWSASQDVLLQLCHRDQFGPGIRVAAPSVQPGTLNACAYKTGNSNAAALATHRLALLYETVLELKELGYATALSHAPDAVILKTLMVHGAEHSSLGGNIIRSCLRQPENSKTFKSVLNQYLGYGQVNESRIHGCHNNQATLIYTGVIDQDKIHRYELPLPASLAATSIHRRLIITAGWFSPCRYTHQDYRVARLSVTAAGEQVGVKKRDYDHYHVENGTVFHQVISGSDAVAYIQGDVLPVEVRCTGRAGAKVIQIPYALVVTLEVPRLSQNLKIYEEVQQALIAQGEVRVSNQNA